jgi:chromosome segregation ATPase
MDNVITKFHPVFWIEAGPTTITDVLSIMAQYGYAIVSIHASNLLFLHPDKHENAVPLDINQVLPEFFQHVERRNQYYSLYLKLNDENAHIKNVYKKSELRVEEYRRNWQKALDDSKKNSQINELRIEEYRKSWQKSLDDNRKINENLRESETTIHELRSRLDNANALYRQSEERITTYKNQITEFTQANEELLEKYAAIYGALSSTLVSYRQMKSIAYSMQLNISKYDKRILEYDKKIREHDKQIREYDKKILEYKKKIQNKNKGIARAKDRAAYFEGLIYGSAIRAAKHIIYHHAKKFANRYRLIGRPMAFVYRVIKRIRNKLHK